MKTMILIQMIIMGMSLNVKASEVELPSTEMLKVIYQAAKRFDVNAQDLIKIAFLESSFKAEAKRVNKNGSVDYGLFQINSIHWSTTCKEFNVFTMKGNAFCAAKLLRKAKRHANNDKHWLGRYHSKTPSHKAVYAEKLASLTLVVK